MKKFKIHPSQPLISDHLSLLPATILTLTVALSPEETEVLAYLISCSANSTCFSGHHKSKPIKKVSGAGDHPPEFQCSCFGCYMSYWVRWNNSPNRDIIHEIIDAYEDGLHQKNREFNLVKNKKGRRKGNYNSTHGGSEQKGNLMKESKPAELSDESGGGGNIEKESPVKKIVSFLGERIWGVWGI